MKPSEIIRTAMNHPSYLNEIYYLCHLIEYEFILTDAQQLSVLEAIDSGLGGFYALHGYLMTKGIYTTLGSQEYKQAAFEHWNKLIEKLEKEGK